MNDELVRRAWLLTEPYHASVYFTPESRPHYETVGLKGWWMGYFASRSAAMGPVPAEVVVATFYNFHPSLVRRAIPDAWRYCTPERVLAARLDLADRTLRRLLGPATDSDALRSAAAVARRAAEECDPAGRPLFAGHASLDWPEPPHLVLWHAATMLREFRGDGHVAALVAHGIDGCEAHVLMAARGRVDGERQRQQRGWPPEEWADAAERLRDRGLVSEDGKLTEPGRALCAEVERLTDELARPPYDALGGDAVRQWLTELEPLARLIVEGDGVLFPNPIGLQREEIVAATDRQAENADIGRS